MPLHHVTNSAMLAARPERSQTTILGSGENHLTRPILLWVPSFPFLALHKCDEVKPPHLGGFPSWPPELTPQTQRLHKARHCAEA